MTCTRTRINIRQLAENSTALAGEKMLEAAKLGVKTEEDEEGVVIELVERIMEEKIRYARN